MTIRYRQIIVALILNFLTGPIFAQYDVRNSGAKGDGMTLDTRAFQSAVDMAFENGGGTVEVSPGTYLIGTVILKENVGIHLQPGSIILGSPDYKDYTEIIHKYDSRTNGLYAKYFMFFAEGAGNISITGAGAIDGNGLKNYQQSAPQNLRPFMIRLVNCHDIIIRDVRLLESANWTLHLLGCRNVTVDGIVIENKTRSNRDGIDIDACNRVTVSNSLFRTGDDAIVMKTTNDTLCQNITITSCIISTLASGIKTGTESNGGFRNITVSNCVLKDIPVHSGIELMTVDGGSMQNILLENITMENVATPFFIRLGNRSRPYKPGQYVEKVGEVSDIMLNNITVLNAGLPSALMGLHSKKIRNITISNYTVRNSLAQKPVGFNAVPFEEFSYPAANVFKNLPAFGIYARNVEELHLNNIYMYSAENETRPSMVFDRVNDLELFSVKGEVHYSGSSVAYFRHVTNAETSSCRTIGTSSSLFELEDNSIEGLVFSENLIKEGQEEWLTKPSLGDDALFEDFPTDIKHIVTGQKDFKGLPAWDLKDNPLNFNLDITRRGSLQLCILSLNKNPSPGKLVVRYEGIRQEFEISWNEWGWAPLTLLKEYPYDKKVDFEIASADTDADIMISRIYVRYQDVRKTD
jgi:hypothetical protein